MHFLKLILSVRLLNSTITAGNAYVNVVLEYFVCADFILLANLC